MKNEYSVSEDLKDFCRASLGKILCGLAILAISIVVIALSCLVSRELRESVMGVVFGWKPSQLPKASPSKSPSEFSISYVAEKTIKSKLLNPDGAKFQSHPERSIRKTGDNTYEVTMWCDGTNSFGGVIRKTYTVRVEVSGDNATGYVISEK